MLHKGKIVFFISIFAVLMLSGCAETSDTPENETQNQEQTESNEVQKFAEKIDHKIVGIEPGAGIMINTEKAMEEYNLAKSGWELQESSSAAMMAAFQDSVGNEEPIIATVWEPHALFAVSEIRKLEDPKKVYNDPAKTKEFLEEFAPEWADEEVASDVIASVVYKGFSEEAPAAYYFFENFTVPADTQSEWIYQLSVEDNEPEAIAEEYVQNNRDLVETWLPDEEIELGKDKIIIGIPPWPGATVKSRVVAEILQEIGYETEVKELDIGVVYTSIADKAIDVNVAGWLPSTHQDYWDEKGEQLEVAGVNVTTTWLGLGVPDYIDESIQSLEDLNY
jgi:glycine betaine/proline transport system substrate-binding protein